MTSGAGINFEKGIDAVVHEVRNCFIIIEWVCWALKNSEAQPKETVNFYFSLDLSSRQVQMQQQCIFASEVIWGLMTEQDYDLIIFIILQTSLQCFDL